ncbi:MAG: hypothetical protein O7A09_07460, partial [Proteobacteria bacterium]|nr:hypothetical protein [Pseudomonadota bacterium]
METVSVLSMVAAGLALYTALYHGFIFHLRRQERDHLWLAVTGLGVLGVSAGSGMLYGATDVETGEFWQRFMFATSPLILVGFLRFSFTFLRVEHRRLDRAALGFSGLVVLLATATPLIFTGEAAVQHPTPFGSVFVQSSLSPVGYAVVAGFLGFFAAALVLHARHLRGTDPASRVLFAALCVWFATGLNDGAVAVGLYQAPYLLCFGYLGILVGTSSILLRRFTASIGTLERFADHLHEMVEERTEEVRKRELQLAHGEQLAAIGTLAASVAHEINNPIAFVHSNLNRLQEIWNKPDSAEDVEEILAECREGTERVRVIVTELLKLSRQSDGRMSPVDLNQLVESVLPVLRPLARYRAELHTNLPPVPKVNADPRLLSQVILNLVVNSLEAVPEGHAEANRVTVSTAYEDGSVWLMVSDTGAGIPTDL